MDDLLDALSDAALIVALGEVFAVRRQADARLAVLVAEVSRRSGPGPDGLAVRWGSGTVSALLADIGLVSRAEAARLCRAAEPLQRRATLQGEALPPAHPHLAEAIRDAVVPVESVVHILTALEQAGPNADPADLDAAERALVEFATSNPADTVRHLATRWRDALDPDGIEPREEQLLARRGLRRSVLADGMRRYRLDLDPLSAALLDAAIDAQVGSAIRAPRFSTDPAAGDAAAEADPRTLAQLGADAIVALARHGNACTATPTLPTATIVVRMSLESLTTGLGAARLDGIEQPISAATARRLAADAELIPAVLGGNGEILDLGTTRRLFTRAQRLALTERDHGCAWPGCPHPPSHTEAHHLRWWSHGGQTNLDNGVLLCSRHHHRIHHDGWQITVHHNTPWFTPPPTIDPTQTPRRGGPLPEPITA